MDTTAFINLPPTQMAATTAFAARAWCSRDRRQSGGVRSGAMTFDPEVKDGGFATGFASLHRTLADGFARMDSLFEHRFSEVHGDLARFEARMMERLEGIDAHFDRLKAPAAPPGDRTA